ncbi:4-hydroxy-3-methylbut-2-enyl diphosphate reductase [candidate division KSB1 bacterium]|nr:4-hydroxy-3-methylbut-2-enyl diphosphate reductase [candidate division KSB1 bacterium]
MKNYFEIPLNTPREGESLNTAHATQSPQFYQRGLGLKKEVQGILKKDYYSNLVEYLRANDFKLQGGDLTIHLAKEFGFCYGVDRAVDYAYQTREKFPDRRIFLTGEIIHNPHVNNRLIEMGVLFLSGQYSNGTTIADLKPEDVVILPAFGVSIIEFQELKKQGCILVDTTCGSVLNVWKRVDYYAQNGYTSIIHGKYYHEETIATSSQALKYANGKYLIVRSMEEAQMVLDYILTGGDKKQFMDYFSKAVSPGFDPDRDLQKIGLANQTTMLSSESLAIAEELRKMFVNKVGEEKLNEHFQTFDTICSATQDRQDAVIDLVKKRKLNLMIVIGGFNSSNTNHLAEITSQHTTTYHIDDPGSILNKNQIRYKLIGSEEIETTENWLPDGRLQIGITAGASTPNNKIGEAIEKIMSFRNIDLEQLMSA